jgi:two-component sensor histidine kinase
VACAPHPSHSRRLTVSLIAANTRLRLTLTKHGSLSVDAGRVDVCWRLDDDIFAMSWTERDGPPVSSPQRRGFGTTVMKAMIERSLDGTVDLDYAPSGITLRFASAAANALEPLVT